MAHVMVLLWAVAFGVGIAAIASTYHRYRLEPLELLRHYWQFLLLANVTVGGFLLTTYVATNVVGLGPLATERSAAALFLIGSFWLVAAFVYKLAVMTLALLGRELPRRLRRQLVLLLAIAPIAPLVALVLLNPETWNESFYGCSELLNVSLVTVGMAALIASLRAAGSLVHTGYRRVVQLLCSLHLVSFALIPVAALSSYPAAWYVLTLCFLAINLTPLCVLGRLLTQRRASPLATDEQSGAVEAFASRHGLSEREREVVRLLLRGYTNTEIGVALCISTHTVKNHVYSVYRKVRVRNRVHLANLVRGL